MDLFSLGLFSNMAPKLKTRMKPTKKTTIPNKRNRAQPPLDLPFSEDESRPQLQDLMDALVAIATCLSAAEETLAKATRLAHISTPENQTTGADQPSQGIAIHPSDNHSSPYYGVLLDQEEQVRARLMKRCRAAEVQRCAHWLLSQHR